MSARRIASTTAGRLIQRLGLASWLFVLVGIVTGFVLTGPTEGASVWTGVPER